jgi:pimeloyl-ACP methyl ester carboxylesterase
MRRIAAVIVLALLVGRFSSARQAPGGSPPSPVGDALVDIGGRRLHVSCTGAGSPTVILEAGLGQAPALEVWKPIQPAVAETTRVCAYDRAGRGTSDSDPRTATEFRTGRAAVEDLRLLLRAAAITGPYVLVGHSLGGAYTRLYAGQFPRDIVGMVLVDSSHEEQDVSFKSAGYSEPSPPTGQNPERTDLPAVLDELRHAHWRADIPLVVLSHGRMLPLPNASDELIARVHAAWLELQRELASRSSRGRLVIAERSGHNVQNDEPQLVIEAIREVVAAARGTVAAR